MKLSNTTLLALVSLAAWFGLDFVGIDDVVQKEPLASLAGLMLLVLAMVAVAGTLRMPYTAGVYALALAIWAALQIETHWATYFLSDASAKKLVWYQSVFGDNWRFLPDRPGRTTPDGYHTVLAGLIVLNLLSALGDMTRRSP
jgi:CDP-diglyceride synthetase